MYHPYVNGFSVLPGLRPLDHDFGNGELDQRFFQEDEMLGLYCQVKMDAADNEQIAICNHSESEYTGWTNSVREQIKDWMVAQLQKEYPEMDYDTNPPKTLDTLGYRIQEDFAVHIQDRDKDWVAYTNVHLPSNWRPDDNIGKTYKEVHSAIPGFPLDKADGFINVMMNKGPFVRFVWTVVFENKLNFHPDLCRKRFDPQNPQVYVKVERQVTKPFPELGAMLFLIRIYLMPLEDVQLSPLITALEGMSPEQLRYKSLDEDYENLVKYLKSLETT